MCIRDRMVSAKGLFYGSKNTFPLMETNVLEHSDCKTGIQIFGSDADIMGEVTKKYLNDTDFDFIDINMGCPMKKIVNNGDGSALLKDLKKAYKVVKSVKDNSIKPLSVKVRLGFNEKNIIDIVKAVEAVSYTHLYQIVVSVSNSNGKRYKQYTEY